MSKIPINIVTGTLQKDEIIVGIDLGTTNSLIAIIHPDTKQPIALKEHDSSSLVPSIVYFDQQNNIVVGDIAKQALIDSPERTIFSVKRLLGKSYNDLRNADQRLAYTVIEDNTESLVKIKIDDKFYSPIDLSAYILKELKARAEHILKTPVNKAVVTVPAYFNDAQRQATRDAGKLAGLDVLRIVNEPTAASLAYGLGLSDNEQKTIAVYDFGGGTFDISILSINNGVFEVLATNGDTFLGGDDIDKAIVDFWLLQNNIEDKDVLLNKKFLQQLRLHAEYAKRQLGENDVFEASLENYILKITRDEFETIIKPIVDKTMHSCKNAMKDAELKVEDIDTVVLVGGSTRIPFIKATLKNYFKTEINDELNPDEVVALGAAIQADILSGNTKNILLLDVTPLSLGVETAGGLMDVLVPRNSKIPSNASRQYTTQVDGQSGMRISVFQGERDLVKDNRKLGEFNLKNIPRMPAGLPKVEIGFLINADGILTVSAKELRSGVAQSIEVKPQYGLSDVDVERMLLDSLANAQSDIDSRALVEAIVEAEQLLKTTEIFLQKNNAQLTKIELMQTAEAMQALQLSLTMSDKNLIQSKTTELNNVSQPYAERIMDTAISNVAKSGALNQLASE